VTCVSKRSEGMQSGDTNENETRYKISPTISLMPTAVKNVTRFVHCNDLH